MFNCAMKSIRLLLSLVELYEGGRCLLDVLATSEEAENLFVKSDNVWIEKPCTLRSRETCRYMILVYTLI